MRIFAFLIGFLLTGGSGLVAQDAPPMITDRPDQTESAALVPRGMVQFEVGASLTRLTVPILNASSDRDVRALGATLARIGILSGLEARIGFAGYVSVEQAGALSVSGVGDLDLGVKVQLMRGDGNIPQVAALGSVIFPTAEDQLGVEAVSGIMRLAFAHELSERLGFGWNLGVAVDRGEGRTQTEILYTASLGVVAADRIGLFVESFGFFGATEFRADRHLIDAGITFAALPNVQLDASGGIGLNSVAANWFVAAGLSIRVPR